MSLFISFCCTCICSPQRACAAAAWIDSAWGCTSSGCPRSCCCSGLSPCPAAYFESFSSSVNFQCSSTATVGAVSDALLLPSAHGLLEYEAGALLRWVDLASWASQRSQYGSNNRLRLSSFLCLPFRAFSGRRRGREKHRDQVEGWREWYRRNANKQ